MKLIDADDLKRSIRRQAGFIRWAGIDGLTQIADEMEKGFIQEIDKAPVVLEFDGEINRVVVRGEEYFKKPKWIPGSERLPSDHERYLLTEEVHFTTGRVIRRVLMGFYDDENDEWYEEMGEDVEVVSYPLAWMPLPEPWKGEEE